MVDASTLGVEVFIGVFVVEQITTTVIGIALRGDGTGAVERGLAWSSRRWVVASSSSSEVAEKNDVNIKNIPTTVHVALDEINFHVFNLLTIFIYYHC